MKKYWHVLLIALVFAALTVLNLGTAHGTSIYSFTAFTGGGTGSLDRLKTPAGVDIEPVDGDTAIGFVAGELVGYTYSVSCQTATNSPITIRPTSNVGCWTEAKMKGTGTANYITYWTGLHTLGALQLTPNTALGTDANGLPTAITGQAFGDSLPMLYRVGHLTALGQFNMSGVTDGNTRIMYWRDKNFTPADLGGDTFTGEIVTVASAAGGAGLNLPPGTAPNSPRDGDLWTTTAGLYARINGTTQGPFSTTPICTATIPTFTEVTNAGLSTGETSNTVTVSLTNCANATVSIAGNSGQYKINSGSYTSSPSLLATGDTVTVQQTSSGSYSTETTSTLTVASQSQAYNVTTGGCSASIPTFTAVTGATISTLEESNQVQVALTDCSAGAPISIAGNSGQYKINSGSYTASAGTIQNNDLVKVNQTSSGSTNTLTTTTLTVAAATQPYNVTTGVCSASIPTFTAVTGATKSAEYISNTVTIALTNCSSGAAISIAGNSGLYKINSGSYTAAAGTVMNGDSVTVKQTSSASNSTLTATTLTVAATTQEYDVTTVACTAQNITVTVQPTASLTVGGSNGNTGTFSSNRGLTVTATSSNTNYFTISGTATVPVAAGTAHIVYSQDGNGTYCAASNVNSNDIIVTSNLACNGTTYSNTETCTYYANTVTAHSATIQNLSMYDALVTAVKSLTTTGCNGTYPGCLGFAYDANMTAYLTGTGVSTVYNGADTTGATTASQATGAAQPSITTNVLNAQCTGTNTPYTNCTGSGTGTLPNVQTFTYDGSSKYLYFNTLPTILQGAASLFGVTSYATGISTGSPGAAFIAYGLSTSSTIYPYLQMGNSSANTTFWTNSDASSSNYSYSQKGSAWTAAVFALTEVTQAANWTQSNAKVNGGTSITASSLSSTTASGQNYCYIGAKVYNTSSWLYWKGNIATNLGFNVQLSSGDMTIIRNFLKTYYPVY